MSDAVTLPSGSVAPGTLVLLVGPSGSGKSTWAARHHAPTQVVSADALRAAVADDPADQGATADAFRVLHEIVGARLARSLTTVVDATNLTERSWRPLLDLAARHGRPVEAIVFDVPLALCLERNAGRPGRSVPEAVVRRQHTRLRAAISGLRRAAVPIRMGELSRTE